MATELDRKDFGMTDKGGVFVIHFGNSTEQGVVDTYQVRHGVRTVGEYPEQERAETIARALVGLPQPVVQAPVSVESPVEEEAPKKAPAAKAAPKK